VYEVTKTDEQREGMIGVYKEMAEHATKTIKTNDKLKEVVSNLEKQRKINPEAKVNIDGNDLPIGEAIEVMRQKAIDNAKEFMERE
jgi:hypothetical protein